MKYVYVWTVLLWVTLTYTAEEYKQLLERSARLYTNLPLQSRIAILKNEKIHNWAQQYEPELLDQAYQLTISLHTWYLNQGRQEPYESLWTILEKYMTVNQAKSRECVQEFIGAYIDQIENPPSWQSSRDLWIGTIFEWHPHPSMFALKLLGYAESHKQDIDPSSIVNLKKALIRDETTDVQHRIALLKHLDVSNH